MLVTLDDRAIAGVDDLHKLLIGEAVGRPARLGVLRNSEQVVLEVVPDPAPKKND